VEDVAHLVAQIAEDVRRSRALDETAAFGVQFRQVGAGQIEGNGDADRAEGNAPFGGKVELRLDPRETTLLQLALEVLQDLVQWRTDNGQTEVAQRRLPGIGLVNRKRAWGHRPLIAKQATYSPSFKRSRNHAKPAKGSRFNRPRRRKTVRRLYAAGSTSAVSSCQNNGMEMDALGVARKT